ncbi:hypothetical protein Adt_45107 [Abeliophyllum distichum]|uniref:Uncharacterized protein n=1 Tax=Abeliophyllum distichum TaxID=126358 RepID=A0ABD1PCS1_9LAMI
MIGSIVTSSCYMAFNVLQPGSGLRYYRLALIELLPNGWAYLLTEFLLWRIEVNKGDILLRIFKAIYNPRKSPIAACSGWKISFIFVQGDWKYLPNDPWPDIGVPGEYIILQSIKISGIFKAERGQIGRMFKVPEQETSFLNLIKELILHQVPSYGELRYNT